MKIGQGLMDRNKAKHLKFVHPFISLTNNKITIYRLRPYATYSNNTTQRQIYFPQN